MSRLFSIIFFMAAGPAAAQDARTGYPTIYHTPFIQLSQQSCSNEEMRSFLDKDGLPLLSVCPAAYSNCAFEGACIIENRDGRLIGINYIRFDEGRGQMVFHRNEISTCLYGLGVARSRQGRFTQTCLDPYFSVAADSAEYFAGDVIFVPGLVGLPLPTGEIHDGYLIVRDRSELMDGEGGPDRFIFFTGIQDENSTLNPLARRGFDNLDNTFAYRKVTGREAEKVRRQRNFPSIPQKLTTNGIR